MTTLAVSLAIAMTAPNFSDLTRRIDSWVKDGYYRGAAMRIVQDDHIVYERTFGDYTPNTVTLIASAGKWLAAATIATVVDEGKLHWSDPVRKWLPEFQDVKGTATLRQLLSHTSGFPDYQPASAHVDDYESLEVAVAHIVGLPAVSAPGERFQYGGLAMQVAGRMAELAAGKNWETLFEERLARPLGMTFTRFLPIDHSGGHSPMLAGGARSSLSDYSRFLEMIAHNGVFRGRRILSTAAIHEMEADQVKNAKMSPERYVARSTGEIHNGVYGLGEWREQIDSSGAATLLTSPSWAGALPWVDKKRRLYALFMAHVDTSGPAAKAGFNSFYTAPVLIDLTHRAIDRVQLGIKTGVIHGLSYEEMGKGEPVIFMHAHGVDRRMWDGQFSLLAKHFRVIRFDFRGYGESQDPTEGVGFTHAEDLRSFMDGLHIQKAHLVGLSLGALVGTDFLSLYPDRVLSLTVAAGAIHDEPGIDQETSAQRKERHRKQTAAKVEAKAKAIRQGLEELHEQYLNGIATGSADPDRCRYRLWRMVDDWGDWQQLHVEGYPLLDLSVSARLKSIKPRVPVLILVGDHDWPGSKDSSGKLAAILPQAKLIVIPNAGHFSNLENPTAFNRALTKFVMAHQ